MFIESYLSVVLLMVALVGRVQSGSYMKSSAWEASRQLLAGCSDSSDCGSNQVCAASSVCACSSGYYLSSTVCQIVPAGSYPSESVTYSSTTRAWQDIVVSTDHTKMAVTVRSDYIYRSVDGGVSWHPLTGSGSQAWETITGNSDLSKMAAATDGTYGLLYLTTDSGNSWNVIAGANARYYHGISASQDFTKMAAAVWQGHIYASTNSGATWSILSGAGSRDWWDIEVSDDFTKMIATARGSYIYLSVNSGSAWTSLYNAGYRDWYGIATSPDFTRIAAAVNGGYLYVSLDGGSSWFPLYNAGYRYWFGVAVSSDFTRMIGVVNNGNILHSVYGGIVASGTTFTSTGPVQQIANSSATSYSSCFPGSYSSAGSSSCTLCPAGSYSSGTGWTSCTACSPGTYSASTGASSCSLCSNGGYAPLSGASLCSVCASGSYTSGSASSSCTSCSAGFFTSYIGSTTCYSCTAGKYSSSGSCSCTSCSAGSYSDIASATTCTTCPGSTTSSYGATFCTCTADLDCGSNQVCAASSVCACSSGYYLSGISCNIVPAGSYPSKAMTYSSTTRPWQDIVVSTDHTKMAVTVRSDYIYRSVDGGVSWHPLTGSGSQAWETITGNSDLSKMAAATDGTYGLLYLTTDSGNSWNVIAGANARYYHGISASQDFTKMAAAVWQGHIYASTNSGATWSILSGAGSRDWWDIEVSDDFTKMIATARGSYIYLSVNSGSAWTSLYNAGYRDWYGIATSPDFTRIAAAVNGGYLYVSLDGGSSWFPLYNAGYRYWFGVAVSSDFTRMIGVVNNGNILHSVYGGIVASGTTFTSTGPVQQIANSSATSYSSCFPGSYSSAGSSSCTLCPAGSYNSGTGWTSCTACSPGTYSAEVGASTSFACVSCTYGTYSTISGSTNCTSCAIGRYSTAFGSGSNSCSVCNAGTYSPAGSSFCSTCQTGRYGNTTGMGACTNCATGTYSTAIGAITSFTCASCASGYASDVGASACYVCGPGTYIPGGVGPVCTQCTAGKYSTSAGMSSCFTCPYGTNSGIAASTCSSCIAGKFADQNGNCLSCAAGTYSSLGATMCTSCPAGKYGTLPGASSSSWCSTCLAGTYSTGGVAACTNCQVGKYGPITGATSASACIFCDRGKYNNGMAKTACTSCPAGTYGAQGVYNMCTDCAPGKFSMNTDSTACTICQEGKYGPNYQSTGCYWCDTFTYSSAGSTQCSSCGPGVRIHSSGVGCGASCPSGKYLALDMAIVNATDGLGTCMPCIAGTFSLVGANVLTGYSCELCAIGSYQPGREQTQCTLCPNANPTPYAGADDLALCTDPASNFITGFVVLFFSGVLAVQYVVRGRYHRVAFLRQQRVVNHLVKESRAVMSRLFHYVTLTDAERFRMQKHRFLLTWVFLIGGFFLLVFMTILNFVGNVSNIFFKSMILWREFQIPVPFNELMGNAVSFLSDILSIPGFRELFYPFYAFFDWVSTLEINVEAINVTCAGATAPIELFVNLAILGISTVVIESNLQLYRLLTFNAVCAKFFQGITQPGYRAWAIRENGRKAHYTIFASFAYIFTCIAAALVTVFGNIDVFLSSLSYLMSLVKMGAFVKSEGFHEFSIECNAVVGWEGIDSDIAMLASIEAYLILLPAIFEVARILVPGLSKRDASFFTKDTKEPDTEAKGVKLPSNILVKMVANSLSKAEELKTQQDKNKDEEFNSEDMVKALPDAKHTFLFPWKLFSFMTPDLWLAVFVGKWISYVRKSVPSFSRSNTADHDNSASGPHTKIIGSPRSETEETSIDAQGDVELGRVGNNMLSQKPPLKTALSVKSLGARIKTFKVISVGSYGKSRDSSGLYFARPGYSVDVWATHRMRVLSSNWHLVKISRKTSQIMFSGCYDITVPKESQLMLSDLQQCTFEYLVVVFTKGNPAKIKLPQNLASALCDCGAASMENFMNLKPHSAYTLIGIPTVGAGHGHEVVVEDGDGSNVASTISFEPTEAGFKIKKANVLDSDMHNIFNKNSYLLAAFRTREAEENVLWRESRIRRMPSYIELMKMEHIELTGKGINPVMSYFLCTAGFGNLWTSVGKRAWALVFRKYLKFFAACLGVWTKDTVEQYEVHQLILLMSVVWDKPFRKKSEKEYLRYYANLSHMKYNKTSANNSSSSEIAAHLQHNHEDDNSHNDRDNRTHHIYDENHEDTPGDKLWHSQSIFEMQLQQEELKRKMRQDYSQLLYGLIALRAVLLQIIPPLTVISIYASITAGTPMLVFEEQLELNLAEYVLSEPLTEARAQEREMVDDARLIRTTELTVEHYCVPNPTHRDGGIEISSATRNDIDKSNKEEMERMRTILSQPQPVVCEWIVFCNGAILLLTEGRLLNFLLNIYRFLLTLGVLLAHKNQVYWLMLSAVFILLPNCAMVAFKFNVMLGRSMNITDVDLYNALSPIGCGFLIRLLYKITGARKNITDLVANDAEGTFKEEQLEELELQNDIKTIKLPAASAKVYPAEQVQVHDGELIPTGAVGQNKVIPLSESLPVSGAESLLVSRAGSFPASGYEPLSRAESIPASGSQSLPVYGDRQNSR